MRIALGDAMSASLTSGGLRRGAPLQWHAQALRRLAAGASVVAALGVSGAAAQTTKPAPHAAAPHAASNHAPSRDDASHPHVYLMRGLLNIFSLGMDQLAAQIARNGIDASVYNHSVEESVVGAIVKKYHAGDHGPYILVGHSLGADAVMVMAQQLNSQGVPVALVVPFDGTESYTAPANVSCVVNLTQRKYAYMQAGAGFHGKLSNVDVSSDTSIDHVTIDKSPRLQAMALKEIMQAARGQSCRPAGTNAPAVARAKQTAPKEIAPQDSGSKENAIKDNTPNDSASKSTEPKTTEPKTTEPKTTAPKQAISPKDATPPKSAKSAAPGKTASPAKGAAKNSPAPAAPGKSAATPG
jgi:thioesterase domain-containing protein